MPAGDDYGGGVDLMGAERPLWNRAYFWKLPLGGHPTQPKFPLFEFEGREEGDDLACS